MKTIALFFFSLVLFVPQGFAQNINPCPFKAYHYKNLNLQTGAFKDGSCYASLSPRDTNGLVYRSYLLTSKGQLMVFNSFGPGPIATDTGSRVFHLLPYQTPFSIKENQNNIEVTLPSSQVMTFSKTLGEPTDLSGAQLNIDPVIKPTNEGGVEIMTRESLVIDSGFRLGGTPLSRLSRRSLMTDKYGEECTVSNRSFVDVKDGEIYLLFSDNQQLQKLLAKNCSHLSL